ncbi:MAG: sialidase [Gemmatimonadota bacterium]
MRTSPARQLLVVATLAGGVSGLSAQRRRDAAPAATVPAADSTLFNQLRYRYIGPTGNRVIAVAGVPGNPNIYYAGAASGGIFKTSDGGIHWTPIFDGQPVSSVGALAVAPSDPNIVWAGTGEPYIRSNISIGWGVFKSTDAGKTWTKMGLDLTGRIGRIVIDPRNPDIVFASALGHSYGPQQERGVYRSTDGGKSWDKVLFVDENTGFYDVEMDPNNSRILFATAWPLIIHTWGRTSGGPSAGIWRSADGGTTWKRLSGNGLPTKAFGKADIAIARSNSNRVYALIETSDGVPLPGVDPESGELWRSDDGGGTWQVVSHDRNLAGRTQYYTHMAVMPDNENEAYFLTASWTKTLDGGKTSIDLPNAETGGGDLHDLWIDPTNGNRMITAHDDGMNITINRGKSWSQIQLPIAQMYHVTVDNRVPYFVYGNRQDGPSSRGPSNSKLGPGEGNIPRGMWSSVGGGESGWATPDPEDSNIIWSTSSGFGSVGGIVSRFDVRTGLSYSVEIWPEATVGHGAADVKYRFNWTFPITISPHDHNKVYVGSQHVHVTTNGGRTWQVISPDLTRNDKSRQTISGGLTPDNVGVEYAGVVFAIAESKVQKDLIWAGTNDGLLQLTQDAGKTWTNVTPNITGILDWGTISNIQPSRFDAGTAYVTVDGHQMNSRDPWVYKTADFGKSWKLIVNGIAKTPLSYAHWVKEDPTRRGLLYLGVENGIYVSLNDGESWTPLQSNLPHAPVHDVTVQEQFNDLVLATYGRGFWILDDITPIQRLTPDIMAKDAHLFTPRAAYRFRGAESPLAASYDPVAGDNPPYGASLSYWIKAARTDSTSIVILDGNGKVLRTFKGPSKAGINRVYWDLQAEPTKEVTVRTSPLYAPELTVPVGGHAAPSVGRVRLLAAPGQYTVKVTIGGQDFTQPLEVRKDPATTGSPDEIRQKVALHTDIESDLNGVVDMINSLESARAQLLTLKAVAKDDKTVPTAADSLEQKLIAVEENLMQLRITGRGQDLIRYPARLAEKLVYLANDVNNNDNAPTEAQIGVAAMLRERARAAKADFDRVMNSDVAAFNAMLRDRGLQGILGKPPLVP